METETVFCRLCMTSGSEQNLIIMTKDLCSKALLCVSVKVNLKSEPDAMLCKTCCNHLDNFYDFKKKCIENNVKYKVLKAQCETGSLKKIESDSHDTFLPQQICEIKVYDKIKNVWEENYGLKERLDTRYPDNDDSDVSDRLANKDIDIKTETSKIPYLTDPEPTKRSVVSKSRNTKNRNKIFQCQECGRTFKEKSVLKKHIMSHMGIKLYSCDICSKKFTREEHKRVHMRAHNGIKPYVCEICGKTSSKRQDLIRHKLIHSDEKKYECKECGKKFKTTYGVRSHMKSHSENRSYSCKRCDKSYKSHSSLQKHLKSHIKKDKQNKSDF